MVLAKVMDEADFELDPGQSVLVIAAVVFGGVACAFVCGEAVDGVLGLALADEFEFFGYDAKVLRDVRLNVVGHLGRLPAWTYALTTSAVGLGSIFPRRAQSQKPSIAAAMAVTQTSPMLSIRSLTLSVVMTAAMV